mgnify:FL=1
MTYEIRIPLLDLSIKVTRKNIRRLSLKVRPPHADVEMNAPWLVSDMDIITFAEEHADWILSARQKVLHQASQQTPPNESVPLMYMGEAHQVEWEYGHSYTEVIRTQGHVLVKLDPRRKDATRQQIGGILETWASYQLREFMQECVPRRAAQMGVATPLVQIKKVRSYWGKCYPTKREVLFNVYLAQKSPPCIEYVVVHELAHLIEAHHGSSFWEFVARYVPDYAKYEQELRASIKPF